MVAAAKYARAERELKPARVYGVGSLGKRRGHHRLGGTLDMKVTTDDFYLVLTVTTGLF